MRRRRKRRSTATQLGLSFLDCICCGFGAVILLFVLTMGAQTRQVRGVNESLNDILEKRLQLLATYRQEAEDLQEKKTAQELMLQKAKKERDSLAESISSLAQKLAQAEAGKENLLVETEQTRRQIAARQRKLDVLQRETPEPVGVPVASNHIIFVIDTSGSMRNPRTSQIHEFVISTVEETLRVYPRVDGIQILDSSGNYILRQSNGRWLDDSVETRQTIARNLRIYPTFSVSNPVPGIIRAIRTFSEPEDPEHKLGIYVFGDEFGGLADRVLERLEVINPRDAEGNRPATINAVGFPNLIFRPLEFGPTGIKFANLMREITYAHDGAFVAMQPEQAIRTNILGLPTQGTFQDLSADLYDPVTRLDGYASQPSQLVTQPVLP